MPQRRTLHAIRVPALFILSLLALFGATIAPASAQAETRSVELTHFAALPLEEGVRLDWQTGPEMNTLGYNLYRAASPVDQPAPINSEPIPVGFMAIVGAKYTYTDGAVEPGASYVYWLERISLEGGPAWYGPVAATALVPQVNGPPQSTSVATGAASSRPWQWAEFTCTVSDPDGWQDIRFVELLINDRANGKSGVWLRYLPAKSRAFLRLPEIRRWRALRGDPPTRMNTSAITELGDVIAEGETLQVTFRVKARGTFLGDWNLFLRVRDASGVADGFEDLGDWSVAR